LIRMEESFYLVRRLLTKRMYNKTVLDNGIRIVTEKIDHRNSVSIGIWVNVGSRDEDEPRSGITHFIEHMIFKGTEKRNHLQIAKELDLIGGLSNAFTGKEQTCFHSKVLSIHLEKACDILSDIFLHSVFDPKEMEKERNVILQEISMIEDTPDEYVHVLFQKTFWKDHPLGRPIVGTPQSIMSITHSDILEHLKFYYDPQNIIIAASGNVDHQRFVEYLEPMFNSLRPLSSKPSRFVPVCGKAEHIQSKDLEQIHVCLGGVAPSLRDEERFSALMFNVILGGNMSSRLFQEIREKAGLVYSIYSFMSAFEDTGLLGIYFGCSRDDLNQAFELLYSEIRKIQKGDISDEELQRAYEYMMGSLLIEAENVDSRMIRLARNEALYGRYISYEEVLERLRGVKKDNVVEMANRVFNNDMACVILGPIDEDRFNGSFLPF